MDRHRVAGLGLSPQLGRVVFDALRFCEPLGARGLRVTDPKQLAAAIDEAFACDRAVVLDVRIDPGATPIPSYRRRLDEGKTYPRPGTVYQLPQWRRSPDLKRDA